jgi:hypothetical protein
MKKAIYIISFIAILALFGYWYQFIRSRDLNWAGYVGLCLHKSELRIDLRASAQYFSGYEMRNFGNTTYIEIQTTTVLNHFCKPVTDYDIKLNTNTKYIKIADSVISLTHIKPCN